MNSVLALRCSDKLHCDYVETCEPYQPMNWTPLNLTVRVGCHLTYQTPVPTPGTVRAQAAARRLGAGDAGKTFVRSAFQRPAHWPRESRPWRGRGGRCVCDHLWRGQSDPFSSLGLSGKPPSMCLSAMPLIWLNGLMGIKWCGSTDDLLRSGRIASWEIQFGQSRIFLACLDGPADCGLVCARISEGLSP